MEYTGWNVLHDLQIQNMDNTLQAFRELHRLTGEKDAETAVDYIVQQLNQYGIENTRYRFDAYLSNPIQGELEIVQPFTSQVEAKTRSFSLHCPEGVEGQLIYDKYSKNTQLTALEEEQWFKQFEGKIVLSWRGWEDYVKKIESYGAKGLIHIWASDENIIHEETVGPVWGNPSIENVHTLPGIPVVGIKKMDGENLIEQVNQQEVTVRVRTKLFVGIKEVSLPVAYIPGETEEYILLSGHYDSWYQGVTDNAVGNALCLELARMFSKCKLKRGIKVAWWPCHSNGRYAGSTWYCDQFWDDLNENCMAHINVDSPGSKGATVLVPRTSLIEQKSVISDAIAKVTGASHPLYGSLPKGADQSFWGVNIPIHLSMKYEPAERLYDCPGSGGGWWWHTEEDLYDKVDLDLLLRDAKVHAEILLKLSNADIIPLDLNGYIVNMKSIVKDIDDHSDSQFDFRFIFEAIHSMEVLIEQLEKSPSCQNQLRYNKLLKEIGGTLNRLMFSYSSRYDFDLAFPSRPFPGLQKAKGIYRTSTSEQQFLFTLTFFNRQRNRFIHETKNISRKIDQFIQQSC